MAFLSLPKYRFVLLLVFIMGCDSDHSPAITSTGIVDIKPVAKKEYSYNISSEFNWNVGELDFGDYPEPENPTCLEFGPDGRLYIMSLSGEINIVSINKIGSAKFKVVNHESIIDVSSIPNHNDDGGINMQVLNRESTALCTAGTASNPTIYASSSDPRMGGPTGDVNLDSNSGIITRISKTGKGWESVDLVRGLPRSEENHATHGLVLTKIRNSPYLLVCQGGHTNAGSPSMNFAYSSEYSLSAAILSIDLNQVNKMPIKTDVISGRKYIYDLPTVDDPTRINKNGKDIGDPFGGNNGLNQAKIVPDGPVRIFAPGFRNSYDIVVTKAGSIFATDNGANGGWGGFPHQEGTDGKVTDRYVLSEPGSISNGTNLFVNNKDHLSQITSNKDQYDFGSYYGGHPNPIRANPVSAGLTTFNPVNKQVEYRNQKLNSSASKFQANSLPIDWPPVPISMANHVEGDNRMPGQGNPHGKPDDIVVTWPNNTNSIAEYTASNFEGKLQGNLLAGRTGGAIHRVVISESGQVDTVYENWIQGPFGNPLGLTCQGDNEVFEGSIWIANFGGGIKVLEPTKKIECISPDSLGYDPNGDYDFDTFSNYDEYINNSDMCNGASAPSDFDYDSISDLLDNDDDNDGIEDMNDPFQLGQPFELPVLNDLYSNNKKLKGYQGLGFTGIMSNRSKTDNYLNWLDRPDERDDDIDDVYGGAVGVMTIYHTNGSAENNDQHKALQFGIKISNQKDNLLIRGKIIPPFHDMKKDQSQGLFVGTGFQDNYIKIVLERNYIAVYEEKSDEFKLLTKSSFKTTNKNILIDIIVNLETSSFRAQYIVEQKNVKNDPISIIDWTPLSPELQNHIIQKKKLAIGIIGTSADYSEFASNWDFINVSKTRNFVNAEHHYRVNIGGPNLPSIDLGPDWISDEYTDFKNLGFLGSQQSHEVNYFGIEWHEDEIDEKEVTPIQLISSERMLSPKNKKLNYQFNVKEGKCYKVRLYMREGLYPKYDLPLRVFDILINNKSYNQLSNIDLANTFGPKKAIVKEIEVMAGSNVLAIDLIPDIDIPVLSGIEIYTIATTECSI